MFSDLMVVFNIICYWFIRKLFFLKYVMIKKFYILTCDFIIRVSYFFYSTGIVYGFFLVYDSLNN